MKHVIYAVYGSNLFEERFMVYINGGEYRNIKYNGCNDKTPPQDLGWQFVPYRLYFAKKSSRWNNKGVAFLSCEKEPDKNFYTIVRLWKISEMQFEDIKKQEGIAWYHREICLGEKDNLAIKTITGCHKNELNEPSDEYLDVMTKGLKETTSWTEEEIKAYLDKFLIF